MPIIILIGLSLFICSSAAIYVTMRASSVSDLRRKPMRTKMPTKPLNKGAVETTEAIPLADHRCLEEGASAIEGGVFFF